MVEAFADVDVLSTVSVNLSIMSVSESIARGNENSRHEPDGTY